jgi:adenylate cyclase class 2
LEAEAHGTLTQRDTYFEVSNGRLKLREETGAVPQLIAYERSNLAGQRESRYRIVEVDQPDELLLVLSTVLGVKVVIAKERRLFLWDGVRIHLDRVDGLGHFIEFEAAAHADSDLSHAEAQVVTLRRAFGIDSADVIGGSYCDLTDSWVHAIHSSPRRFWLDAPIPKL